MYTIYLTFVVAVLFAVYRVRKTGRIFSLLSGIPVVIVGGLLSLLMINFVPMKDVVQGPFLLAAVRTADGVTGTFVLGSGSVRGSSLYHVLVKNNDGSLTPYTISADHRARIIEDASLKGVGYWKQMQRVKDREHPFAKWVLQTDTIIMITGNELRVPVGTVVQAFSIK